jgi:apolipoprotein N-acyltransferase
MPYISSWPWLEKRLLSIGAAGMSFDLGKGSVRAEAIFGFDLTTLSEVPKAPTRAKLATPICFEITETSLCRQMVRLAAADGSLPMLVNVTNDGWFGNWKPGKQQHLLASRWRSVELGVPVVRAANTGISAAIEFGKTGVRTLEHNQDGFLVVDVEFYRFSTFYREIGDLCWVFPLALGGLVILAIVRRMPNNLGGGSGTETAKAA